MGLFDDIGSAFEGLSGAKDEAINQAGEQLGNVVPEEVQNIAEGAQDPLGQLGEILPGQDEEQQ